MQRYKLNTRFLIILVVIFAAVLGGGYGLWAFQVYRSAPGILAEARKAREEKQYISANELYRRYLSFRPNDIEAQVEYAETQLEFAEAPQANVDERVVALMEAERMLRNNPIPRSESEWSAEMRQAVPKLDSLKERSARARIRFQLYQDAIDHLKYLVNVRKTNNPEHQVLWLEALVGSQKDDEAREKGFELVGYDPATEQFDVTKAVTPHEPRAYVLLAGALRRLEEPQLADLVMNQLVAANEADYEAFLERSLYWMRQDNFDLAHQDWLRAHELNKEDIDVLLAGSRLALRREEVDEALRLAEEAQRLFPDEYQTYIDVARAHVTKEDRIKAIASIDQGLKAITSPWPTLQLLVFKCDLQLRENLIPEATETIGVLKQLLPSHDIPRYFEGRALIAQRKWVDAVQIFEEARPGLSTPEVRTWYPMLLPDLDQFRGLAYQQMGRYDQALEAFRASLAENPDQPGLERVVQSLAQNTGQSAGPQPSSIAQQVAEMKSRDPADQRWDEIEAALTKQIADNAVAEPFAKLQWAEYRYLRGQTDQAYQLAQEILATDPPLNVMIPVVRITAAVPEGGPQAAEQLLDQAVAKFGDNATVRLERGRLWMIDKADNLVGKLWTLAEGSDQWDVHQQSFFYKGLAEYFRQIGQPGEADKALERALGLTEQDVDALLELFASARMSQDNAAMQDIQERILAVVGSKNDSSWQYTEATRLMTLHAAGAGDPQLIQQAEQLAESVSKLRPRWHEGHRLRGDILALQGKAKEAIDAYTRALDVGPPIPLAVLHHTRLLVMRQQFREARRVAELLPEQVRLNVLGKLYPEILLDAAEPQDSAEITRALDYAAQIVEANPENSGDQLWYANLLVKYQRLPEAEAPVRKAVELEPQDMQNWIGLVRYYIGARRIEDAEQALREARLALPEHDLPLLLAQSYAMLGRWWQAEREYLIAHRADPGNLDRMRLLAEFYLGPSYPETREDRYTKAVPYINALLKQDTSAGNTESVQWARRKAAEIFARTGDYQNTLKAERLLKANEVDGQMPSADKLALAKILAVRPEPGSRQRAIDLLLEVRNQQILDVDSGILLAQLFWKSDRQSEARNQVIEVVGQHGEQPKVWQTFIALLLANGDFDDAAQYFGDKLERTLPKPLTLADIDETTPRGLSNSRTLTLGVQVWAKQGQKDKAVATLYGLIPRDQAEIRDQDIRSILRIGELLVLIDEKERAGQMFQLYAAKRPSEALVYVKFLGAYQDFEEAFQHLETFEKETPPGQMFPIVQTALSIISARRDEIGGSKDALVAGWLDKALRENPDSSLLLGLKADLFEMQEKYAEAQQVYERILDTPGFVGLMRARVLNNLAYLLALRRTETDRALRLIEEARTIRGPSSDILDTEAVVHMARGNHNAAIANLELAVTEEANAEKWFHLARAFWLANRRAEALTAWGRAQDFDIGPEKLNRMEHATFQQFAKEMEEEQRRAGAS